MTTSRPGSAKLYSEAIERWVRHEETLLGRAEDVRPPREPLVVEGEGRCLDVATILGLSPRTVQKHLEHIYQKLGVETRTAAAAMALQIAH